MTRTMAEPGIKRSPAGKLRICMLIPIRYGPDMRVNPQVGIFSYLARFGHDITWVLSAGRGRVSRRHQLGDIVVRAAPSGRLFSEARLLGKALNLIPASLMKVGLFLRVLRESRYDLLFAREDTLDGLAGVYGKWRYGIPFVYELTNPLEQEWEGYRIEGRKPLFLWQLMARIKVSLKTFVMRRADIILTTTKWFEDGLTARGIPGDRLLPFPNGVDTEPLAAVDCLATRERYGLGDSPVVVYAGVIARTRNLAMLLDAFAIVVKRMGNCRLLMVGDGTDRKNLERMARELGIGDSVIFTGRVPQPEVMNLIATAEVGVSPLPPHSFYRVSSPIKLFEYMARAKPVVASEEVLEHRDAIRESGGGILAATNPAAFAGAIMELLNDGDRAKEMGRKGKSWIARSRTFEILARPLEERLKQLVRGAA